MRRVGKSMLIVGAIYHMLETSQQGAFKFAEEEGWSFVELIASAGFRQEHQNGEDSCVSPFVLLDTPCSFNMV